SGRRITAQCRDRTTSDAGRWKINRRDGNRGLPFFAVAVRENGHAVLPGLRFTGGKTDPQRNRTTGRSGSEARTAQDPRASGQSAQRFSQRRRALGRTEWI